MLNPECPGCQQMRNDLAFVHDELARQKRHVEAIGNALAEKSSMLESEQKELLAEFERHTKTVRLFDCSKAEVERLIRERGILAAERDGYKLEAESLKKDRDSIFLQNKALLEALKVAYSYECAQEEHCSSICENTDWHTKARAAIKGVENRVGTSPTERPCCVEAYARGHAVGRQTGETFPRSLPSTDGTLAKDVIEKRLDETRRCTCQFVQMSKSVHDNDCPFFP